MIFRPRSAGFGGLGGGPGGPLSRARTVLRASDLSSRPPSWPWGAALVQALARIFHRLAVGRWCGFGAVVCVDSGLGVRRWPECRLGLAPVPAGRGSFLPRDGYVTREVLIGPVFAAIQSRVLP